MIDNFEILKPHIFPDNIVSGVTLRNSHFGKYGFTISGNHIDSTIINEHRNMLAQNFEVSPDCLKYQKQVHGDSVRAVEINSVIEESDAMITGSKGVALVVSIADCAALLMYAPDKNLIAAVHSGWRSTKLNIVGKTIDIMVENYDISPESILCFVSPCAGGDKYEVGEEVARFFPESIKQIGEEKYFFDIKHEIFLQLIRKRILPINIEISDISTISDEKFHSFRRDKENSGRMGAFIMMRE